MRPAPPPLDLADLAVRRFTLNLSHLERAQARAAQQPTIKNRKMVAEWVKAVEYSRSVAAAHGIRIEMENPK